MSKTTRCKMRCTELAQTEGWDKQKPILNTVKFAAAYGDSPENKAFFAATPTASMEFSTVLPACHSFQVGREYYVDIIEAPSEDAKQIES